jgi:hypothetical protein
MSFHARKLLYARGNKSAIDPYWNNVSLLIHADGLVNANNVLYLDSSANGFTLTSPTGANYGIQGSFSPFPLSGEYNPTIHGGSNYFGWSSSTPSAVNMNTTNSRFHFLNGTFSIEFWVYFKSLSGTQTIVTNATTTSGWSVVLDGGVIKASLSGPGYDLVGTTTISPNTWYHVAVSGTTGSNKLFINGTAESTFTGSTSFTGTVVRMGLNNAGTNKLQAYLSNLRITQTQVYASNFTRPTSPVTLTANGGASPSSLPTGTASNVPLLCNFTNAAIFDQTKKNNILLTGLARRDTSQFRFGGASFRTTTSSTIPNAGQASTPSVNNFNFGSSDFTIEFWVYILDYGTVGSWLFGGGDPSSQIKISCGALGNILVATGSGSTISTTSNTVPLNTWTFISVVRSGNTFTTYINGVNRAAATYSGSIAFTEPNQLGIGSINSATTPNLVGYMDDIRVTLGVARYSANFPIPTTAFPNY